MIREIERFSQTQYDLLVIGGGINGAAVAHLAAKRGLKTALLEKGDFAGGTSSKSTKLIHGGIRYLENLEFDLVYESLRERHIQLKAAPHLVKPLEFVIPVYRGDRRPLWMMHLGVFLYDILAGPYRIQKHRRLSVQEVLGLEPGLKREGLTGGVLYYDAQMDDARLCLENVLSACEYGAHAANYVKVESFLKENGRAVGVLARDLLDGRSLEVRAKQLVCAGGPWTNELLRLDDPHAKKKVRTTKGIHIVYKGEISRKALLIASQSDKRIFFVIPWKGNSLIGTTDTDYVASPDEVRAERADIDYLVCETRRLFPALDFSEDKIVTAFAGLRPLVRRYGSASRVTRRHVIFDTVSGITFVIGGKYTTYRKVALDCVSRITQSNFEEEFRTFGGAPTEGSPDAEVFRYGVDAGVIRALKDQYGSRYTDVLELVEKMPELREKLSAAPPVILAQIVYAIQTEMARTKEDILERRLGLCYVGGVSERCLKAVGEQLAKLLKPGK